MGKGALAGRRNPAVSGTYHGKYMPVARLIKKKKRTRQGLERWFSN